MQEILVGKLERLSAPVIKGTEPVMTESTVFWMLVMFWMLVRV